MIVAPHTHDETARIELLHSLHLLDTPADPVFDRITRLAARLLNVPIAVISLIDTDRQWFKSIVGLDATETPREQAFCAHAIHGTQPLVVSDAKNDKRFFDNPLVVGEPKIRFYAGAPIFSTQDIALGTLCIIDRKPRELSADDLLTLQDLAELVRREIMNLESTRLSRSVYEHSRNVAEESEAWFRATIAHAPVGIAMVGTNGQWIRVNTKLCNIVGYSADELLNLSFQEITHPDDLDIDMSYVQQMLNGELTHYTLEKRYLRKSGEPIWISLTVSLMRDNSGEPMHFISVIEDIQARKETEEALRRLRRNLEDRVQERTQQLQQTNNMLSLAVDQQRRSEDALRAQEAQLRAVLENAQDAFVSIDESGLVVQWNRQAELTFGWSRDEAIGRRLEDIIIPATYREAHNQGMKRYLKTGNAVVLNKRLELVAMRRDGSLFPVEVRISPLPSETGLLFCAFLHDISERKRADEALRNSQEQLHTIANNLPVQISYVDSDLIIRFINEAYRTDVGLAPEFALGKKLSDVLRKSFRQEIQPHVDKVLTGEQVNFEMITTIRQQERVWSSVYIPDTQNGKTIGFYIMSQDITAQKQLELSLERKATRDALTGLSNRSALMERLDDAIGRADLSGDALGVLFLDLDGFKQINDRFGHDGGDTVLKQFALRLTHCVRSSDTVARLAGDEFVILLESLKHGSNDVENIGNKILDAMRDPISVNGEPCHLSTSVGVYVWHLDQNINAEQMIATADMAMYQAKRSGKNRMHVAIDGIISSDA
ncbi:MAG: hypothetical protein JWM78_3123 [Verrucomicrobiaceae bacterium]|nr:hypothetical protein [Verrucomicrobiaceae bacterium]